MAQHTINFLYKIERQKIYWPFVVHVCKVWVDSIAFRCNLNFSHSLSLCICDIKFPLLKNVSTIFLFSLQNSNFWDFPLSDTHVNSSHSSKNEEITETNKRRRKKMDSVTNMKNFFRIIYIWIEINGIRCYESNSNNNRKIKRVNERNGWIRKYKTYIMDAGDQQRERSIVYQHISVVCCSTRRLLPLERVVQLTRSYIWLSHSFACIRSYVRSMAQPTRMLFTLVYSLSFVRLFSFIQFHSRRRRLTEHRSVATKSLTSLYATFLSSCFYFSLVIVSSHFMLFSSRCCCCCCCSQRVHWLRLTTFFFLHSNAISHKWPGMLCNHTAYALAHHWDTKSSWCMQWFLFISLYFVVTFMEMLILFTSLRFFSSSFFV